MNEIVACYPDNEMYVILGLNALSAFGFSLLAKELVLMG